jgi:hypothetical protein
MRTIAYLAVGLLSLSGCLSLNRGERGDPNQIAIRKELAELVKAYRVCLQKNEDNPTKAKENCGVYREALQDLVQAKDRRTIGQALDRFFLMEKEPS